MNCERCSFGQTYKSSDEATRHLMAEHFGMRTFTAAEESALSFWISTPEQEITDQRNSQSLKLLGECLDHIENLHTRAQNMIEGVASANEDKEGDQSYRLPSALVRAFEQIFVFIVVTGHAIPLLDQRLSKWTSNDRSSFRSKVEDYLGLASFLGFRADFSMTKALKDVILMLRTGSASESVNYVAVGPRYVALAMHRNLLQRKLVDNTRLVESYRRCTSKLVSSRDHSPWI